MDAITQNATQANPWRDFVAGDWQSKVDVRNFIQLNYQPYEGDDSFLAGATERTKKLWDTLGELLKQERAKGVLDVSADRGSSITAHDAGYIDQANEVIVGLQTDAPLKRAIMPNGGLRMVENGLEAFGFKLDPMIKEVWEKYRKSHNQGVFDVYTRKSWLAASPA
ncbi:Formate acetyltransferase 1 [Chromobacterium violaceum]|uniref:Formate acetyltransferase 1 n=1 Tax=Chromobacterium violaceum TaxID=536 RepID=A0A447T9G3_CHRVL|nr:Formate acetyltransferase 1 [Chromobacterium violaceum]